MCGAGAEGEGEDPGTEGRGGRREEDADNGRNWELRVFDLEGWVEVGDSAGAEPRKIDYNLLNKVV